MKVEFWCEPCGDYFEDDTRELEGIRDGGTVTYHTRCPKCETLASKPVDDYQEGPDDD